MEDVSKIRIAALAQVLWKEFRTVVELPDAVPDAVRLQLMEEAYAEIQLDGNEPFDGTFDQTPEIARLATKTGVTVAHRLAKAGILSPALRTDDILSMEALGGLTVRELLELADGGFFERKERERELVRRADKAERIAEEAEGTRCGPSTCPGEASGHPARSSTNHEQHTRRR